MHEKKRWGMLPALIVAGLLLILAPGFGMAQGDACPALVQQALAQIGQNCAGLDRNSACYGFNRVDATFSQPVAENFFSQPSDRSALTTLQTVETAPLDLDKEFWGIAVLNVQANVPNTLPGQAVTFVLLGDVSVENAVPADQAVLPSTSIEVRALVPANIRSAPSANANLIGSVAEGTLLPADAVNADGRWVRVLYASGPGWVSREIIDPVGDLGTLTVLNRETRTPMQAFYFRTGVGDPQCLEAPALLVVQSPEKIRVDLSANGADFSIGSTVVLRLLEGNVMQLMVVDGQANLGGIILPAGFTMTMPLAPDLRSPAGGWENFRPLNQTELLLLQILELIPPEILSYGIEIPTQGDILATLQQFAQSGASGQGASSGPAAGQANCSSFRPTSPLGGMAFGLNTFYWDPAPGATSYRVNIFDENGNQVASYETTGPTTSLVGDTSGLGGGISFSWQVVALVNGQIACSSATVSMQREAPPPPATLQQPTSTPEPSCNYNYNCEPWLGETFVSCPYDCW